jgi:hypothetical protein
VILKSVVLISNISLSFRGKIFFDCGMDRGEREREREREREKEGESLLRGLTVFMGWIAGA